MAPENHDGEKHFAEIVKDFGETSMNDNGLDTGEQAKAFALGKVRDALSQQVNQHVESWLSPWGNASVDVKVDNEGHFTGSRGAGLCRYKIMIVISPGASLVLLSRMMGW
ncbi:invasin [Escherichia coli]|uniref:Invasin n=1 Tax=Escherichia coli TaxID=562 RepID=A0A484WR54_ECOLX|nr:invasin [Escherichia coli]